MKYFTIYASRNDTQGLDEYIAEIFDSGFKIEGNDNEYAIRSKKLLKKNHIFIKIASEESEPDYFSRSIPGMMGFYENIQIQNEHIKSLVFTQISVINTMLAIQTDKEYDEGYYQRFLALTRRVSGIGFLPDGTLLGQDGLVIVYPDGTIGPSKFTPHACTNKIRGTESKTTEGEERKQKSIAYLTKYDIPFIEHLPELPPAILAIWRPTEQGRSQPN